MALTGSPAARAMPVNLVVLGPGAVQGLVPDLLRPYEREHETDITFVWATAGAVVKRVVDGTKGDVVIATDSGLASLAAAGLVDADSVRAIGSMGVGVAVKHGAPKPAIHDVESFKQAILAARSVTYGNPAKGGQSGIHIAKVFAEAGLDKMLGARIVLCDSGPVGMEQVAQGDIEIALGQISEILASDGIELVCPFPPAIQGAVTFAAGVHAASPHKPAAHAIIERLTSQTAKKAFKAVGFAVH